MQVSSDDECDPPSSLITVRADESEYLLALAKWIILPYGARSVCHAE